MRHDLPRVEVIGLDAKMTAEAGKYEGMDRYECRDQLIADLRTEGFLVDIEDHQHAVGDAIVAIPLLNHW